VKIYRLHIVSSMAIDVSFAITTTSTTNPAIAGLKLPYQTHGQLAVNDKSRLNNFIKSLQQNNMQVLKFGGTSVA
jgi:hypothetical protein